MNVYQDIAQRTNGDIYIGVVGPVRTGKSTFIKKFMETLVLPNIQNPIKRERAQDELPQSSSGRTIMTAEPKFIPAEAVEISLAENAKMKVRMIDCVGYIVKDAIGFEENGIPRMVNTPWSASTMPFESAAEIGTKKVICEHSTIGILVTTDGTITGIARGSYEDAERRVVEELKGMGKPFIILLNSTNPHAQATNDLALDLNVKYGVSVVVADVMNMGRDKFEEIFENLLNEFYVTAINYRMPVWFKAIPSTSNLMASYKNMLLGISGASDKLGAVKKSLLNFSSDDTEFEIREISTGTGEIYVNVYPNKKVFYDMLCDISAEKIIDDLAVVEYISAMAEIRREYEVIKDALNSAKATGYGVVLPKSDDITTKAPQKVFKSNRYGLNIVAKAPTMHIISADVYAQVSPVIGTDESSIPIIEEMIKKYEDNPETLWNMEVFGKTLGAMIEDNIYAKMFNLSPKNKKKIQVAVNRAANGESGLMLIVL